MKLKKVFSLLLAFAMAMTIAFAAGCNKDEVKDKDKDKDNNVTEPVQLASPQITLSENVISWGAVEHADGYVVKEGTTTVSTQTGLTYTIDKTEEGEYTYTVTATSTDEKYTQSAASNQVTYKVSTKTPPVEETPTKLTGKIYLVGDSTVCAFSDAYYIPRYGYGTQLHNYFICDENQIVNLALSGKSSWSFTFESNYQRLSEITEGDYLIIGFGHNDQKDNIYTNPNLATDSTEEVGGVINGQAKTHYASFKRSLYENYIKVAEDAGATAILCTPIVRLNDKNDYSGNSAHVRTSSDGGKNPGGDWSQAIRDLGQEKGVTVVDLTALTKSDYTEKGYAEASKYHAATTAKWTDDSKTALLPSGIDGTHTSLYGAHMNAYYIANTLKSSTNSIAKHVKADIEKPTAEKYYEAGIVSGFKPSDYTPFNPSTSKTSVLGALEAENWYTTVFGSMGASASTEHYQVIQNSTQDGSLSLTVKDINSKTKIASSEEGFVCAFTQLASNATFSITADVTINTYKSDNQTGFGIMLRNDIYIDGRDKTILGEYAVAGVYGTPTAANVLFTRVKGKLDPVNAGQTLDTTVTHKLSIVRSGKTVTITFDEMSQTYDDFDVRINDADYMYICLFASRGTDVTFNNVNLQVDGTSEA